LKWRSKILFLERKSKKEDKSILKGKK